MPHIHAEAIKAWADGAEIEYRRSGIEWCVAQHPSFDPDFEYRAKPAREYPLTRLAEDEIISAYYGGGPVVGPDQETAAFYRIANAAIRHAVDADQLVLKSEVLEVARQLSAKHTRAVAEAVFAKCHSVTLAYSGAAANCLKQGVDLGKILAAADQQISKGA